MHTRTKIRSCECPLECVETSLCCLNLTVFRSFNCCNSAVRWGNAESTWMFKSPRIMTPVVLRVVRRSLNSALWRPVNEHLGQCGCLALTTSCCVSVFIFTHSLSFILHHLDFLKSVAQWHSESTEPKCTNTGFNQASSSCICVITQFVYLISLQSHFLHCLKPSYWMWLNSGSFCGLAEWTNQKSPSS